MHLHFSSKLCRGSSGSLLGSDSDNDSDEEAPLPRKYDNKNILFRPDEDSEDDLNASPANLISSPKPLPSNYEDAWDADHIKLPCSPSNVYRRKTRGVESAPLSRWYLIQTVLYSPISDTFELQVRNDRAPHRYIILHTHLLIYRVYLLLLSTSRYLHNQHMQTAPSLCSLYNNRLIASFFS